MWTLKWTYNENNFKKKNIKLLTIEQQESYKNAKVCYVFSKQFQNKYLKDEKYCKVRYRCHYRVEYRGAVDSVCNLKYSVPKKIPLVFHNESNYDYNFIIRVEITVHLFRRKYWKKHNLYSSNRKRRYKKW